MNTYLLIINAGSSSIKFALYRHEQGNDLEADVSGQMESIGIVPRFTVTDVNGRRIVDQNCAVEQVQNHQSALAHIQNWLDRYLTSGQLIAVGHRVVHGGQNYIAPVLINEQVLADLEYLNSLAPLHQPHNVSAIRLILQSRPDLPQIACFDTAFHNTQPEVAKRLALPRQYSAEGLIRYGFHGLSYEYIASMLPTLNAKLPNARVIVAHLGNGASLCALNHSRSIATTMGFSPLDGLVMGTRCGAIDPGVLLYLLEQHAMDVPRLTQLLYHQSGLLGVSGLSSDMRVLLESDSAAAQEAIELFVYRIAREIGSLVAALGGLDALIFTGGIGENAAQIRELISDKMAWLGLAFDATANQQNAACISLPESTVSAWIIPTNENLIIARHTLQVVNTKP